MTAGAVFTLQTEPALRLSDEAFWDLCRANPELRLERTARGELVVMAPAGADSGRRNVGIAAQLWIWNERERRGVVFDSSAGFTLPSSAIRAPDAAWIARERWVRIPIEDRRRFAHLCPDFVVELRSPSDSPKELSDKMAEYVAQGARLAWLIDPIAARAEVYRPGQPVEILDRPAVLSGEDVLPGFVLDLTGILTDDTDTTRPGGGADG